MYETIQHLDMTWRAARWTSCRAPGRSCCSARALRVVAIDGAFHLMQIGYRASCATNGVTMRIAALNLEKEDVAIGISHCGHTRDTVEAMRLAHHSGAATIAITSYENSPLCEKADVVLAVHSDDILYPTDGAIISARTSHICIRDALSVARACRNYDRSIAKIRSRNTLIFPSVRE